MAKKYGITNLSYYYNTKKDAMQHITRQGFTLIVSDVNAVR